MNLLDGARDSDPYPVLTQPESVCVSWHKNTMVKWYSLQGSSEPVPLTDRVEGQELNDTLSFERKHILEKE